MEIDIKKQRITELWSELLGEIGEDITRSGIQKTPERIATMYEELFRGYDIKAKPKFATFINGEDGILYNQMIVDEGTFYSFCEHHCLPFMGKYWFSYIPHQKGKIVGLSKVAHLVRFHSAKLQIQERLVKDVIDDIWNSLSENSENPKGMSLVIKAKHLCKSMRGVKLEGEMTTIELCGLFKENSKTRQEFFNFVNNS